MMGYVEIKVDVADFANALLRAVRSALFEGVIPMKMSEPERFWSRSQFCNSGATMVSTWKRRRRSDNLDNSASQDVTILRLTALVFKCRVARNELTVAKVWKSVSATR